MHTVYKVVNLQLVKRRDKISAICAQGDRLLVGLANGDLDMYRAREVDEALTTAIIHEKQIKRFARKIEQLAIVKEIDALVSLADATVKLYHLRTLEKLSDLGSLSDVRAFSVNNSVENDDQGVPIMVTQLAIGSRRKLIIHSWLDTELQPVKIIALPERPKGLVWTCSKTVCVAFSSDYRIVDLRANIVGEPFMPFNFPTSSYGLGMMNIAARSSKAHMLKISNDRVLLIRDVSSVCLSSNGKVMDTSRPIAWTSAPEDIGFAYPYLISASDHAVQIWNVDAGSQIQTISLPGVTMLHGGKCVYAASPSEVWRLVPYPYGIQLDELIASNQLHEAISLLGQLEDVYFLNKATKVRNLRYLKAVDLFSLGQYQQAMDIFSEICAPPNSVLKLYPGFITGEEDSQGSLWRHENEHNPAAVQQEINDEKPDSADASIGSNQALLLGDEEFKKAVRALVTYLVGARRQLNNMLAESKDTNR